MSLAERWKEYVRDRLVSGLDARQEYALRAAFYAGAEAGIFEHLREGSKPVAEIEAFKKGATP